MIKKSFRAYNTFVILLFTAVLLLWRKSTVKGRIDGLTDAYFRKYYDKVYNSLVKANGYSDAEGCW